MTTERERALEALPGWCWDGNDGAWWDKFALLRARVAAHGAVPPQTDPLMGNWIKHQRAAMTAIRDPSRKKNTDHVLTPERIEALEAVPGWDWTPSKRGRSEEAAAAEEESE